MPTMNRFLHFVLGHQNCSIATHVTVVGYGKTHLSTCDHPPFPGFHGKIEARLVQIHIHPYQPPTGFTSKPTLDPVNPPMSRTVTRCFSTSAISSALLRSSDSPFQWKQNDKSQGFTKHVFFRTKQKNMQVFFLVGYKLAWNGKT